MSVLTIDPADQPATGRRVVTSWLRVMIIELAAIVLMVAAAAVVAMKLTAASDRPDRALIGWAAGSLLLAGAMEWASHRASRRNDDLQILLVPRVLLEGDLFPRLFPRRERTWREEV